MGTFIGWAVAVIVVGGLFFLLGYAAIERQTWLHEHCEVIGKVSGSVGMTTTVNSGKGAGVGVGPVYIPGKTGYRCDDGLEYWE